MLATLCLPRGNLSWVEQEYNLHSYFTAYWKLAVTQVVWNDLLQYPVTILLCDQRQYCTKFKEISIILIDTATICSVHCNKIWIKLWAGMVDRWCDLWKPVTHCKKWNCKIKEINIIILMFFFIFYSHWTSVTFDTSIRGDPSKKFWKENNSNFHLISITQNINFAPCDSFFQITSHMTATGANKEEDKSYQHVLPSFLSVFSNCVISRFICISRLKIIFSTKNNSAV